MASFVKIKWRGKKYETAIEREIKLAVERSAERVKTATQKALSKTGPSKDLQQAFGKNKKSGPHSYAKGMAGLSGVSVRKYKNVKISFGGTFTDNAGNKHDGMYFYGEPLNKWVKASAPGKPPHKQLGLLRQSIQYQKISNGMSVKVGPLDNLKYARRHELGGTSGYPARPYLMPSFDAQRDGIEKLIKDAVKKAGKL
jgi:phage gpG-like protein